MKKPLIAIASFLVLSAAQLPAALISYEGFNYAGGAALNGQSGGTGWTYPWSFSYGTADTIAGSGLNYTDGLGNTLTTTGNAAFLSGTDTGFVRGSTFGADGTTVWLSFLLNPTTATTYSGLNFPAFGGAFVGNPGNNEWGVDNFGGGALVSAGTVSVPSTAFLCAKIDFGATDTVTFYLNPNLDVLPTGGVSKTFALSNPVTDILLAHGGSNYLIDEIRIGDTYADVMPYTAVPEPSTVLLFGFAGALFLYRNRRSLRRA